MPTCGTEVHQRELCIKNEHMAALFALAFGAQVSNSPHGCLAQSRRERPHTLRATRVALHPTRYALDPAHARYTLHTGHKTLHIALHPRRTTYTLRIAQRTEHTAHYIPRYALLADSTYYRSTGHIHDEQGAVRTKHHTLHDMCYITDYTLHSTTLCILHLMRHTLHTVKNRWYGHRSSLSLRTHTFLDTWLFCLSYVFLWPISFSKKAPGRCSCPRLSHATILFQQAQAQM